MRWRFLRPPATILAGIEEKFVGSVRPEVAPFIGLVDRRDRP
jgi:hypothetical protein